MESTSVRQFLRWAWESFRQLDFRTTAILISVVMIEILSSYVTSRQFFRQTFGAAFGRDPMLNFYEYVYWFIGDFVSQFFIPLLLILFILRAPLRDFGIGLGNVRLGLRASLAFWAVILPVLWVVSSFESFQLTYPHSRVVRTDWLLFLLYELCFILYMTGWEFIWRGYMLFGLKERFGETAIVLQMIPFTLLHFGKPLLETVGAVIGGLALGFLAVRTKSFWYGVLTHVLVMFSIDLLATLRFRTQMFDLNPLRLIEMLSNSP